MEVTYMLEPQDVKRFHKLLQGTATRYLSWFSWLLFPLILAYPLYNLWDTFSRHPVKPSNFFHELLPLILGPLAILAIPTVFAWYASYKDRTSNPLYAAPHTMRLTADALLHTSQDVQTTIRWQGIRRIEEDYRVMGFCLSGTVFHVLPKHVFATPDEAERFLTTAQAYWNAAKNGTPLPADVHDDKTWPPAPRTL